MKHMKKLLSLVLTLVTVFALSATAMAVDITITNGATDAEYSAYKLLNATNATDDTTKFAYTVNSTYFDVLKEVTGKTTGADINLRRSAPLLTPFTEKLKPRLLTMLAIILMLTTMLLTCSKALLRVTT